MKELLYYKFREDAIPPSKVRPEDGGYDIYSTENVFVPIGETVTVPLGLGIYIPEGHIGKFLERSSTAKKGLSVGGGLIDATYAGPLSVVLHNLTCKEHTNFYGKQGYQIEKGDRIAQVVFLEVTTPSKIIEVNTLWTSNRGAKAFGSSGR